MRDEDDVIDDAYAPIGAAAQAAVAAELRRPHTYSFSHTTLPQDTRARAVQPPPSLPQDTRPRAAQPPPSQKPLPPPLPKSPLCEFRLKKDLFHLLLINFPVFFFQRSGRVGCIWGKLELTQNVSTQRFISCQKVCTVRISPHVRPGTQTKHVQCKRTL